MNALNLYQINIFKVLKIMNKTKHSLNPRVFDNTFTEIYHRYPTKFERSRNSILYLLLLLNKIKNKLLESEDELTFSNMACTFPFRYCNICASLG